MEYTITPRDGFLDLELKGPATADGFARCFDDMLSRSDWMPGSLILTDESGLDASDLTVQEIQQIADACARLSSDFGSARAAILVARDLEFGMNRMWGVFVEGRWNVDVNFFRSRDEALEWLLA